MIENRYPLGAWYDLFGDESVAVATSPFGEGVTVGGRTFLCKETAFPLFADYICASESYAQGLVDALGTAKTIKIRPTGERREFVPGGETASGVVVTGVSPEQARETAIRRVYGDSNGIDVGEAALWGVGIAAAGLAGWQLYKLIKG